MLVHTEYADWVRGDLTASDFDFVKYIDLDTLDFSKEYRKFA